MTFLKRKREWCKLMPYEKSKINHQHCTINVDDEL